MLGNMVSGDEDLTQIVIDEGALEGMSALLQHSLAHGNGAGAGDDGTATVETDESALRARHCTPIAAAAAASSSCPPQNCLARTPGGGGPAPRTTPAAEA